MKLNNKDIQKLKEKGVDPSVILDLLLEEEEDPGKAPETPKNEKPEKAPETPKNEKPEKAPEQTPEKPMNEKPEKAPEQKNDMQDQILKAIEKLTGAVQTSNLLNAGSTGPDVDTTEDILASIINPKGGK